MAWAKDELRKTSARKELTTTLPANSPSITSLRTDMALRQEREADSQSSLAIADESVCSAFCHYQ